MNVSLSMTLVVIDRELKKLKKKNVLLNIAQNNHVS